ncbi:hypothetical protein HMPREF1532_04048 [Bacteroides salyersiae WAL 10018 = DSM 18765 = JCM 12988]|nr:hypothetical protein HMPREF1532_04048 [Bacteroides salyersiae WAL 10018 = DSM 18765 = JCM 12988]
MRHFLGMKTKSGVYRDIAAWDTNFIDNMKMRDDVELTVISAHGGLKKSVVHFEAEGIKYYFVRCDRATLLKHLIKSPSIWHALNPMRPTIRQIVRKIHPDIVALMGAENAYYSGTVLGLEKEYPVIMKAQTIYNNPDREKYGVVDVKNAYVERLIFETLDYVSVTTKMYYQLYREYNKTAYNFYWSFGTTFHEVIPIQDKEFDFVNFANSMIPAKGFTDVLQAMVIVVKSHPKAKLNLIGTPNIEDKIIYDKIIADNYLENNVIVTPFFENQNDMFQHLQKSRFAVLPYKLDYIASTTFQAMYYEMPVVVYKTAGTPTLNEEKECVLIADMENVKQLAEKMLLLLDDEKKASELCKNAKELIDFRNDGKRISDVVMNNFRAIVAHFRYGTPIPKELIYNPLGE